MGSRGAAARVALRSRGGRARATAAAVLLCCSVAASAGAQTPDRYWRLLREENRPAVLLASSEPHSVPQPLGEALRLIRLYELTDDDHAARRARELLRRARRQPDHRAWYSLALAMVLARGPDSRMRDSGDSDDWYADRKSLGSIHSLRMLRSLLAQDHQFREAALELAAWALDRNDPEVAAEADAALARLPRDTVALLARTSLNLLVGDFPLAAALAAEARRRGASSALTSHARAYALLQDPATATAGVEAYYDGIRGSGQAGRAEYARWLEPILTREEATEWRELDGSDATDWLVRFWQRNAARQGAKAGERLAEHYRRMHAARVAHPLSPLSLLQIQAPFVVGEDSRRFGLSLRGLMLVRHGDPFRLAALEECLSGQGGARAGDVGIICPAPAGERLARFQRAATLAGGDSFDPFTWPLDFGYGVWAFRGADGGTDVVFAVALPARGADALVTSDGAVAGVLSAILLPDTGDVTRIDSVFRAPLPPHREVVAGDRPATVPLHAVLPSPHPGRFEYRVTVSDLVREAGGRGGGRIDVPDLSGFGLSDLVVAPLDAAGTLRRGTKLVALPSGPRYRPSEGFRLYYEIYGLDEEAPYRTDLELVPARAGILDRVRGLLGGGRDVRLRFERRTPAPDSVFGVQELRSVELDGLEPGTWILRVTVTDLATGRVAARETTIEVSN